MGDWYSIGLVLGLAAAIGVTLAGLSSPLPRAGILVPVVAAAAGVALGLAAFQWVEAVAGGLGGLVGGAGAAILAAGALRRGGTRGGLALLLLVAGAVAAGLAFVPVVGYLETVVLALLALRVRARAGSRYAGLRILARD